MSSTTATLYPDSIAATWLAARLAVEPAKIDVMRRNGDLIAVREPGSIEWRYPAWQFEGGRPRRGIARIVAAARSAGIDETRLYDVLTAPLGLRESGRQRLVDLLLEGREDEVVTAVKTAR
ncbi:MAG: hypothetical protein OEW52_07190 [Thermoleophilia bacterium]|nr:hypothetical protein [Thermoleophilia bacterium]MDH4340528.1 hypothetical protein [Thermoleophilia bacterium]MDH5280921.1 hypothetical protein [Thermoleophilia bacterium]